MSSEDTSTGQDHFVLEKELNNLYMCIEKAQKELINIHKPRRKRARLDYILQSEIVGFKKRLHNLKTEWTSTQAQVFKLLSDSRMLSNIADDVIKALYITRVKYKVEDEYYMSVFGLIMTPIIASIMDEQELSKDSKERQFRRKCFIKELLRATSSDNLYKLSEQQDKDVTPEIIDVCSSSSQTQQSHRSATQEVSTSYQCCSWEEITIIKFLIDAVSIHSKGVTRKDVEFSARIYHIINISHIVDTLKHYINELKYKIDLDLNRSRITEAMEKFEESITRSLEHFDAEHPLSVFRNNLRFLLIQIRMLRSSLSQ